MDELALRSGQLMMQSTQDPLGGGGEVVLNEVEAHADAELEITDVNKTYLAQGKLRAHVLSRGNAWLDTGTPDSLLEAGSFVQTIEKRQGLKISCVEEIAYRLGYIDGTQLEQLIKALGSSDYGRYLRDVLEQRI